MSLSSSFVYTAQPARVVFGRGRLVDLPAEVQALGARRALVLCTPEQREIAERAAALLGDRCAGIHAGARMHVPIETARQAAAEASRLQADCAVAIGGGSTIGLGKAIALESPLPILAVPTTYAGSEMTPIYGITADGVKRTGREPRVLPRTVIYDPDLSDGLPYAMSVTSGINAIAHAAEGLYARDGNPVMALMAEQGLRSMAAGLRGLDRAAEDTDASRALCLEGAWLCGTVLGHVGMALHHKLCHTLGGTLDLPHAQTHTVVLAHALAYNAPAVPQAMARIAHALDCGDAAAGIHALAGELGAPLSLRELGMHEADIERVLSVALANPYWNPRPIEADGIRQLLRDAWAGRPPRRAQAGA
ncbi:maleylacetate reductase [Pseudaquabacterium rugosum]|uniref:Maleylacetate reductase n=1 Tax=Pseudaquabacterium rugosum TaxID=2984194 RepID=A0ABU9BF58_9BURK